MDLIHIIGILIIFISAIVGLNKGFVKMLGDVCASVLTFLLLICMKNWVFKQLLSDILVGGSITFTRIVICVVSYIILFLLIKLIFFSLGTFSKLPVIKGLNKLLGLIVGGTYGIVLVGVIYLFYDWIFLK